MSHMPRVGKCPHGIEYEECDECRTPQSSLAAPAGSDAVRARTTKIIEKFTPAVASSDLLCAAIIMQGLLASGHYTHKVRDDGEDEPEVRTWDRGSEWQEDGADRRYASHVAADAERLLEEMKERLNQEASPDSTTAKP